MTTFTLQIGGWNLEKIRKALEGKNVSMSSYAQSMLERVEFQKEKEKVALEVITLRDWFSEKPTTEEIFSEARKRGYGLCPAEVGPLFPLQHTDYDVADCLTIGMEPLTDSGGSPFVFRVSRVGSGLELRGGWASPGGRWGADDRFLFCVLKPSTLHPSNTVSLGLCDTSARLNSIEYILQTEIPDKEKLGMIERLCRSF